MLKVLLFLVFPFALLVSCQKQSDLNNNLPLFSSTDSVYFDTVFTTLGGVTQKIKLINPNDRDIDVSSITLAGGTNSPFLINIDGTPGPTASNLNIQANDSLYIFVSVYVKPVSGPLPFILQDSILIHYNGGEKIIQLSVWGQNAHFLKNPVITANTVWTNDLPYVIYGGLRVDSNTTLTIQKGTHIYMHADAPLYIDGSLQVQGDSAAANRIYFSGDRLDDPYSHYPGSWPGIFFSESSKNNQINYAVFQNGYHGLVVSGPSADGNPKLILNQCIINNFLQEGLLGISSGIRAVNCLVSNCGQNIVLSLGGEYQFAYCTVVTYANSLISHQLPVLSLSNALTNGGQVITGDLQASFTNCIFWGSQGVSDEAAVDKEGNTVFNVLFDHSILKQINYPANVDSSHLQLNANPEFIDTSGYPLGSYNFQLQAGSPALDQGADLGIPIDLNGYPRPATLSDLGSYERQ